MVTKKKGFSFIEILIVISLIGILTGIGSLIMSGFHSRQEVEQTARTFADNLKLARQKAISGARPPDANGVLEGYTIRFVDDPQYALFANFSENPTEIRVSSYRLSKDSDIIFFSLYDDIIFYPLAQGCGLIDEPIYVITNSQGYQCTVKVYCITGEIEFDECS